MTREELEAALKRVENEVALWGEIDTQRDPFMADIKLNAAAARKQLALMAELVDDPECGDCDHLPRKVYPQETVEKIAEALRQVTLGNINASLTENRYPLIAVAVLDALGETE